MKVYLITEHYPCESSNSELVIIDNAPDSFKARVEDALKNNGVSHTPDIETEEEEDNYVDNDSLQYLYHIAKKHSKQLFAKPNDKVELLGKIHLYHLF